MVNRQYFEEIKSGEKKPLFDATQVTPPAPPKHVFFTPVSSKLSKIPFMLQLIIHSTDNQARTIPKTPRTPHHKDPTSTPRFYPAPDKSNLDSKVSSLLTHLHLASI